ncbi:ADP-glyceromanno-heptose 6-epimerase [bacterium]|nr:MAG: ADP-glyceromanno-heptose 6-epimerase [bacterium]
MKRALVTGGAGFVGSNLALELERRGVAVVVLDDFSSGHFENLKGFKGDCVAGDVSKPAEWLGRIGAVDCVFHQAAITDTTVMDQKRMLEVNVEGFRNVLSFAVESGVRRVVYASSAGTYGAGPVPMREGQAPEPMNVYGFSKMVMERAAEGFLQEEPSLKVVGLRYFNVFGPGEAHKGKVASMIWQLYGQMKAGKRPRIFRAGEQYRDHIYVKDVVAANLKAAEAAQSGVYNVCTGRATTFNEVVSALNAVLGTSLEPDYFENPYSFYQNETQGDPSAAAAGLGFKASWAFRDAVADYLGNKAAKVAAGA